MGGMKLSPPPYGSCGIAHGKNHRELPDTVWQRTFQKCPRPGPVPADSPRFTIPTARRSRYHRRMPMPTLSAPLNVLVVAGSQNRQSSTRAVLLLAAESLRAAGASVDILDLSEDPLPMFNPDSTYAQAYYPALKARVAGADALLLGSPDYHGCMSSALKNFLDHFWTEFAGKLFASVVASHDKGLTVTDQIPAARQCYAWTLPYGVSFADKADVKDGQVVNETFQQRLHAMTRDLLVYGPLLAEQRRADLTGTEAGFLARYRK